MQPHLNMETKKGIAVNKVNIIRLNNLLLETESYSAINIVYYKLSVNSLFLSLASRSFFMVALASKSLKTLLYYCVTPHSFIKSEMHCTKK